MHSELAALPFHRITETDWSCLESTDEYLAYSFAAGIDLGYPANLSAAMKRQTFECSPLVPIMTPTVDADWISDLPCKTIFDNESDYRRYRGTVDDGENLRADVLSHNIDDLDSIFTQTALS